MMFGICLNSRLGFSATGDVAPPGPTSRCLLQLPQLGREGIALVCGKQRSRLLLIILKYTGQHSTTKNCMVYINNTKIETLFYGLIFRKHSDFTQREFLNANAIQISRHYGKKTILVHENPPEFRSCYATHHSFIKEKQVLSFSTE